MLRNFFILLKQSATDGRKTASEKVIQKTAEGEYIYIKENINLQKQGNRSLINYD